MPDWKCQGKLYDCDKHYVTQGEIELFAKPGQDEFNLPELHFVRGMPKFLVTVENDFTLTARCQHDGKTKFDAAGLYAQNEVMKFKFGVEHYGKGSPRIVSVRSLTYSDEVIGDRLNSCDEVLVLTRNGEVLSCYRSGIEGLLFQRAFFLEKASPKLDVGFFAQAPFSSVEVKANFNDIILSSKPTIHTRM